MGDFPIHNCQYDGADGTRVPVVQPISVLDCEQPECVQRATHANRAIYYDLAYIKSRVEESKATVQRAIDQLDIWQLNLEAKLRAEDK